MQKNKIIFSIIVLGALALFAFQQVLLKPIVRGNLTLINPGHIHAGDAMRGTDTFTTSATSDTIVFTAVSGVTTSSVFVVAIKDVTPVANDLLSWTVNTDTLFVHRPAGTTSGLGYSYIRID